jgi:hypothetical protein
LVASKCCQPIARQPRSWRDFQRDYRSTSGTRWIRGDNGVVATAERRSHIADMVRIQISPVAFHAIAATLPGNGGLKNKRALNGDWLIWLPHDVLAKLNRARGPSESYSDVILRVVADY